MSTPNVSSPAPTTQPAHQEETLSSVTGPEGGYRYPEQKHTGAVGLGPNYGRGASAYERFQGLKEQLIGKILHNPQKIQHGHDLRTGLLKKREQEQEDRKTPLRSVKADNKKTSIKKDEAPPQGATAGK